MRSTVLPELETMCVFLLIDRHASKFPPSHPHLCISLSRWRKLEREKKVGAETIMSPFRVGLTLPYRKELKRERSHSAAYASNHMHLQ